MDIKSWMPEFKVSAESDSDLIKYFLKTSYVSELINTSKWLLLGRKGTGKTAIYEYFKSASRSDISGFEVISLNFKDYPWPIHQLYKETMEGELSAYNKSWHYIIIVKALSKLFQIYEENGFSMNEKMKKAKKVLEFIYGNPDPTIIDIVKSKIFRLSKLSLPSLEVEELVTASAGEVSFEDVNKSEELKSKLKSNAFTLLDYFQKVLVENIESAKILITIDQLDENWDTYQLQEYSKILTNLIHVCQDINNSSKFKRLLKVLVFLRTDIYDTLRFNDKTKIFQDSAIEIRWTADSLNDMFVERIKRYKPNDLTLDLNVLKTDSLFEVKTVKNGASPFRHILRRSFYRPRDIIVFMNKVREVHSTSKLGLYTSKDLYTAEADYSENIYGELIDEWENQKPDIKKYLEIIQNIGAQTFDYEAYSSKYRKKFPEGDKSEIEESLDFLLKNSVIGQIVTGSWTYCCTNPHMQIEFAKQFHVNNGLKKRLVLKEVKQIGAMTD